MRIAFGIVTLFPGGGLQRDCLDIAKQVSERGHDVTIYTERVTGQVHTGGIAVVQLPNGALSNHRRQEQFAADFVKASAQSGLKVGFNMLRGLDVLYCADRSMHARLSRQPYLKLLPRYRVYGELEKNSFAPGRKARIILLSQNQVLEFWRAWHTEPRRMYLVPPTLSEARRRPELRSEGTRMKMRGALGRTDASWVWLTSGVQPNTKGTDRVIRALAGFPDALLLVVGLRDTDKAAQDVVALARKLDVSSRIQWLGHREDVPQVMAAADLLLHPSRYDTTGTVILEALVNGLPVIATGACGYAPHVTAAGAGVVVAEPFEQTAFNAAIRQAQDRTTSAAWSKAGIAYGERPGLSDGRACAAQIITAAAGQPAVASDFDLSKLQPGPDSDWDAYFKANAQQAAAR